MALAVTSQNINQLVAGVGAKGSSSHAPQHTQAWGLSGHEGEVLTAACGVDYFITCDSKGVALVWSARNDLANAAPENVGAIRTSPSGVSVVDSALLTPKKLCGACGDGRVTLWDIETGMVELSLRRQSTQYSFEDIVVINAVACSDAHDVLWGGDDGYLILSDVRVKAQPDRRKKFPTLQLESQKAMNLRVPVTAVDMDEDNIYAGGVDGIVRCLDRRTYKELYRLPAHKDVVCSVQALPHRPVILTSGMDNVLRTWDTQPFATSVSERQITTIEAHHGHEGRNLIRCAWDARGTRFVSGSGDGRVLLGLPDSVRVAPLPSSHRESPANGAYFLGEHWVVSVGANPGVIVQSISHNFAL